MTTGHRIAVLLGLACGALFVGVVWPIGGYDSYVYFLKDYFPGTTIPAWGYLILQPLGRIPWPLSWGVLNALTVVAVGAVAEVFGWRGWRWFVPLFSASMLLTLWFGQIEAIPAIGTALGWLVLKRRIGDGWMGLAWMCWLLKPQSGIGALVVLTWWFVADGHKLWPGLVVAAGIVALTFVFWGWWPAGFFSPTGVGQVEAGDAIWPFGLLALPVLLLPTRQRQTKLIFAMATGTLASPYFFLHHILGLQIVSASVLLWVGTALIMALTLILGVELPWALPLALGVFLLASVCRELLAQYPVAQWPWSWWRRSKEEQHVQ